MEDLLGGAAPNLRRDRRLKTMVDRLSCDRAPPSRNSFGERAKDGDGTSIGSAIGAPDERRVFNILPFQGAQMWPVMLELSLDHRLCAIVSRIARIWRRDTDVQSRQTVSEGLRENISGSQVGAWAKARDFRFCAGVTLFHPR